MLYTLYSVHELEGKLGLLYCIMSNIVYWLSNVSIFMHVIHIHSS